MGGRLSGGPLAELREELAARGIRPAKRLGQNFMVDPNLAGAVARASGAGEGDVVLEVGPGAGHLTKALLALGARVLAVEIDARLADLAAERLGEAPGLRILQYDAMAPGGLLAEEVVEALRAETAAAGRASFRVASNLPYGVAATFLIALASSGLPWAGGAVTLQREVAERLAAPPGTKAYGASSVIWQLLARGRIDRTIPREVFWPRPEVFSALLVIEPLDEAPAELVASAREFGAFVKALFSSRRKVLRKAAAKALHGLPTERLDAALGAAGIDPGARVETVAPERLLALWRRNRGDQRPS